MKTKQCSKCKKRKLLSEFHKQLECKGGVTSECKGCKRGYYQTRKIKIAKQRKKYYQTYTVKIRKRVKKYQETIIGCLHNRFNLMKYRCTNSKGRAYKYYGGRGIKLKFKSANNFIDYVLDELKIDPRGLIIDRIDNNGHYEPGNIRFVTVAESNRNKRKKYNKEIA